LLNNIQSPLDALHRQLCKTYPPLNKLH